MTRRAVLVCPGRGSYNRTELGYLARFCRSYRSLLQSFDGQRAMNGQAALAELDGRETFSASLHTRSDNASALIYACSYGDALSIDDSRFEVVAVTGNSMGWYTALACAGALSPEAGFELVNGMGGLMHAQGIGGQLIYPVTGTDWVPDSRQREDVLARVASIAATTDGILDVSIELGAMLVLAGNEAGIAAFESSVPRIADRFPLRLRNHAAFHTALLAPVAGLARESYGRLPFRDPVLPLIGGRGAIWYPFCHSVDELRDYTLGYQVTETYDFTSAMRVAAHEFAPDVFIVAGPGTTLADSVAQSLVASRWRDLSNRTAFEALQAKDPVVLALGDPNARKKVVGNSKRR